MQTGMRRLSQERSFFGSPGHRLRSILEKNVSAPNKKEKLQSRQRMLLVKLKQQAPSCKKKMYTFGNPTTKRAFSQSKARR